MEQEENRVSMAESALEQEKCSGLVCIGIFENKVSLAQCAVEQEDKVYVAKFSVEQ